MAFLKLVEGVRAVKTNNEANDQPDVADKLCCALYLYLTQACLDITQSADKADFFFFFASFHQNKQH